MVDSSIHFKVVQTKSIPLLTMIQLGSAAWEVKVKDFEASMRRLDSVC